jgi:hypothetical protein
VLAPKREQRVSTMLEELLIGEHFRSTAQSLSDATPPDDETRLPEQRPGFGQPIEAEAIAGRIDHTQLDVGHGLLARPRLVAGLGVFFTRGLLGALFVTGVAPGAAGAGGVAALPAAVGSTRLT